MPVLDLRGQPPPRRLWQLFRFKVGQQASPKLRYGITVPRARRGLACLHHHDRFQRDKGGGIVVAPHRNLPWHGNQGAQHRRAVPHFGELTGPVVRLWRQGYAQSVDRHPPRPHRAQLPLGLNGTTDKVQKGHRMQTTNDSDLAQNRCPAPHSTAKSPARILRRAALIFAALVPLSGAITACTPEKEPVVEMVDETKPRVMAPEGAIIPAGLDRIKMGMSQAEVWKILSPLYDVRHAKGATPDFPTGDFFNYEQDGKTLYGQVLYLDKSVRDIRYGYEESFTIE